MTIQNLTTRRYILNLPTGETRKTQNGDEVPVIEQVILSAKGDARGKGDPLKGKCGADTFPLTKAHLAAIKKNKGIMALVNEHRHLALVA